MSLSGFTQTDFNVFKIDGLEERMSAIQTQIQPKFKDLGDVLCADLSMLLGNEMYLHIAKHARRKVNPPKDTWMAIAHNKRGYKKHPHFQLGLFDDHLFVWLAFIYEVPNKATIAKSLLEQQEELFSTLPDDYVISLDHMKKEATLLKELSDDDLTSSLVRFRDVKKAEFLVGRHLDTNSSIVKDGQALLEFTKNTYEELLPLYRVAMASE